MTPLITEVCSAQNIPSPVVFGATILGIEATPVTNFSHDAGTPYSVWTKSQFAGLNFCNVSVTYTHPGRGDEIHVQTLLPELDNWNGRFLGASGGGWSATLGLLNLIPAVDAGFAVADTDAGAPVNSLSSESWALLSPGNPDIARLDTFAGQALHEQSIIGKSITESYYNQAPAYSYFAGCSQGGRQGNMLAQRYPEDYDGIAALAPAINWSQFFAGMFWPRQVMYELNYFPQPCEVLAWTAAATEACDKLDGLVDGVVSRPESCSFDPFSLIGTGYKCDATSMTFTTKGASLVNAIWTGPRDEEGAFEWYGYPVDTNITSVVASTTCDTTGHCEIRPWHLPEDWLRLWVAADPDFNLTNMTRLEYTELAHAGLNHYDSIIGTRDPDLSKFRDLGRKLLSWHGVADEYIPVNGSLDYHGRVHELDANADDYFRLFLAPGVEHCLPGVGPYPTNVMQTIMDWVEKGVAPEQLVAQNVSMIDPTTGELFGQGNRTEGMGRPLCLYPLEQEYVGGDGDQLSSFRCVAR
ncbi:hypothetical protein WHR41_09534 [Cladosporium halotolerans]|uniref:Carboxylic ester hydrolase n=1 Tax=Cladosporium halotolerans TaxID=1052096 RepID=A0AB34KBA8_9PEZI